MSDKARCQKCGYDKVFSSAGGILPTCVHCGAVVERRRAADRRAPAATAPAGGAREWLLEMYDEDHKFTFSQVVRHVDAYAAELERRRISAAAALEKEAEK